MKHFVGQRLLLTQGQLPAAFAGELATVVEMLSAEGSEVFGFAVVAMLDSGKLVALRDSEIAVAQTGAEFDATEQAAAAEQSLQF